MIKVDPIKPKKTVRKKSNNYSKFVCYNYFYHSSFSEQKSCKTSSSCSYDKVRDVVWGSFTDMSNSKSDLITYEGCRIGPLKQASCLQGYGPLKRGLEKG